MNSQPHIMIQCIFSGQEGVAHTLLIELEKITQQHLPQAHISLQSLTDYWKIEGSKKVVYGFTYPSHVMVHDFIKMFPLTWDYVEGMVYDVDLLIRHQEESAVWSKLCSPDEVFLLPSIEWVNIYTWVE